MSTFPPTAVVTSWIWVKVRVRVTDYLQQYKDALNTTRSTYFSHLIHSGSTSPKALFSTLNKLLKSSDNTSNSFTTDKCNSSLSLFQTKIDTIYNNLPSSPALTACNPFLSSAPPSLTSQSLSQFYPISPGELCTIMTGMKPPQMSWIPSHLTSSRTLYQSSPHSS